MRITCLGARTELSQIERIEYGLQSLGHITEPTDSPDVIFCNDTGLWDKAIEMKQRSGAFLILNILDLPYFLPNFLEIVGKLKGQCAHADAITCISETTRFSIKRYLGIDVSKVRVIGNPIKDVCNLGFVRHIPFLYCGRANDSMKRVRLVKETMELMSIHTRELVVCGPENPGFGNYIGLIRDEQLQSIMNSCQILIYPSCFDGLGLPPIEFCITGGVPILCNDSPTSLEFFPSQVLCSPNAASIAEKVVHVYNNYSDYQKLLRKTKDSFIDRFNRMQVAKNILDICKNAPVTNKV